MTRQFVFPVVITLFTALLNARRGVKLDKAYWAKASLIFAVGMIVVYALG